MIFVCDNISCKTLSAILLPEPENSPTPRLGIEPRRGWL
jgi:hypothetical protein